MRKFRVMTVMGIPIELHISLLVFLPFLAWRLGNQAYIGTWVAIVNTISPQTIDPTVLLPGLTPWLIGIGGAIGLFIGVAVHELGHAWVARRYDVQTSSITLWLFGGVAHLEHLPTEWDTEFWIAIAGPITSVLIGLVCYGGLQAVPRSLPVTSFLLGWLALTNVSLAVFNLLPAFPMDGGRVLRSLLARSRPFVQATRMAVSVAKVIALLLGLVGVFTVNILLILVAGFVYLAAVSEATTVVTRDLLSDISVRDLVRPDMNTVLTGTSVLLLVDQMLTERRTAYIVVDDTGTVVGVITLANLQGALETPQTTVDDIMTKNPPTISADATAFELFTTLGQGRGEYVLLEEDGRTIGLISQTDFMQMLSLLQGARQLRHAVPLTR